MNKKKNIIEFNCLEYKEMIQEKIYNNIRDLSNEQEKEYFNSKAKRGSFKDLVNNQNYIPIQ